MSDIEFIDGLIVKEPRDSAPDYVKAAISIKRAELIAWLQARSDEWINVDVKESQGGKWYAAVNTWKPEGRNESSAPRQQRQAPAPAQHADASNGFVDDEDIPFAPIPRRAYL